jgi:predicted anti-sigma-YlaC factor YlaD
MVTDEEELAAIEEHLLGCPECAELAQEAADYVDTIRVAINSGDFDLAWGRNT